MPNVRSGDTHESRLSTHTGPEANALAFDDLNDRLYALVQKGPDRNHLLSYGLDGSITDLGTVASLPGLSFTVGDIDRTSGTYYVGVADTETVYAIDLTTLSASSVTLPAGFGNIGSDFTVRGGQIWTATRTEVVGVDLNSEVIVRTAIPDPYKGIHGTIFLRPDGSLTFYVNETSQLVTVSDPGTGEPEFTLEVTLDLGQGSNDGANGGF